MNVLVTGSTGFLGSYFMNKFNKKFNILHGLSRREQKQKDRFSVKLSQDKKLEKLFLNHKYDVVIHLGATSKEKTKIQMLKENCYTTENLLQCCIKNNVKKIIFASATVIYDKAHYLPIDEIHPKRAKTNFIYSKIINEKICESYRTKYGIEVIVLRISSVYGPGQLEKFVIPTLIRNAVKNNAITLHKYQNGFQLMDFIHVDDVCNAIMLSCGTKINSGIYNIASGNTITVKQIGNLLRNILKIKSIIIKEIKSETEHYFYDISLAKKELKFLPKMKFNEKTIKDIIHYYNYR